MNDDLVKRLRSNAQLPICPYHRLSPEYWTTNDTDPCKFCGTKNELDTPDKCTGADMRVMIEAANAIERLTAELSDVRKDLEDETSGHNHMIEQCHTLTAERDAAWEAGRDAAAKVADEYTGRMWNALNKQRAELKSGTVPACKADAGDHIAAAIRALATSKPE